jgi:hypothetical protein
MTLTLDHSVLQRLCDRNLFPVPSTGMVFFGLRGCVPVNSALSQKLESKHDVMVMPVDYRHPRCSIGQWLPKGKKLAVFPGSTVPHETNIKGGLSTAGRGVNELMLGYYADYRKGVHKAGTPTGHPAFRQTAGRPIRRTATDLNFDNDDRVEFDNPFDNLHAGWCQGLDHPQYSSAGCQVVVGFPGCPKCGPGSTDQGAWKVFRSNAYDLEQDSFVYVLASGAEAQLVGDSKGKPLEPRVRFGSKGDLVRRVQAALAEAGCYEGRIDDEFGERTLRSVLAFQTAKFGPDADDGVVGGTTAGALGIAWPAA